MWREVRNLLPEESVIYLADGKNCPYGERSKEEIAELVRGAIVELVARGVKLVVVACNTATAVAIESLREEFDIPFVGMEPAVKPAALSTRSGVVGILATRASLEGELFRTTSSKYADRVKILSAVGEGFVEAVEESREQQPETLEMVRRAVEPMIAEGADRIVLGCTHYPHIRPAIARHVPLRAMIIDGGEGTARETLRRLTVADLLSPSTATGSVGIIKTSGDPRLIRASRQLLEK